MPLLKAVLATYPKEELRDSWSNFVSTMGYVGADYEFSNYTVWSHPLDAVVWKVYGGYLRSRQHRNEMPWFVFRGLQEKVFLGALGLLVLLLPAAFMRRQNLSSLRMLGLSVVVLSVLPANAFLCGVISGSFPRHQARLAWLLVLLAALLAVVNWQQQRRVPRS
jgi:hypothetical protein